MTTKIEVAWEIRVVEWMMNYVLKDAEDWVVERWNARIREELQLRELAG